jgi:hypothetical protein
MTEHLESKRFRVVVENVGIRGYITLYDCVEAVRCARPANRSPAGSR